MELSLEDEDQATLDAALLFLDEFEPLVAKRDEASIDFFDDGGQAIGDDQRYPPASEPNSIKNKAKTKRGPRPKAQGYNTNRARENMKKELLYLRNKVLDMETQLKELQRPDDGTSSAAARAAARSLSLRIDKPSAATLTRNGRVQVASRPQFVWEEIASRQYAERHKAELENLKLKAMLEAQIKVTKSFESLLQKRATTQLLDMYRERALPLSRQSNVSDVKDDAAVFEMLLAGLAQSYEEVDAIFEANGLSKTEDTFQDAMVHNKKHDGISLELFANKTMPFDIHATSNAVWLHVAGLQERIPSRWYYERQPKQMETTEDTIVESYGIQLQAKRTHGNFRVRNASRRFVAEDRVLIAWRMVCDPVEFSSQPMSGIRFFERGYILVKRPTTRSPDFALMQTCFIMTPQRSGCTDSWNEPTVDRLSSFLVDTTARNIYFSHQLIENFLLDEALKGN